jgi:hypothetical protein
MSNRPRYADEDSWPSTAKTCRDRLADENAALLAELQGRPRQSRYTPDFSPIEGGHAYIQWKGTDVCLDFQCQCGASGHFDGYFAYSLRCGACGGVFDLPHSVEVIPTLRDEYPVIVDVEMDSEADE